ncbi:hypothetical protein EVAR_59335_1 [Eumeta japonica]|uniref:Uncharacterized protein n=1 Tax=Eumeta variegata TaxID=151549 RepID=A0A4C1Z6X1_EUMVA|nr:hypothetical protein EVAR_59335_1 [Eumeta japonica]
MLFQLHITLKNVGGAWGHLQMGTSRVVDTPACRLAAFGKAIIEFQLCSIDRPKCSNFRGKFLVGFSPTLRLVHAGVRYAFFTSSLLQDEKKKHYRHCGRYLCDIM